MSIREKIKECANQVLGVLDLDGWTLDLLMLPIICGGHAVIHGMIGTGKSVAVMALANLLRLEAGIYQCHPETMPGDLIGFEKFNQKTRDFDMRKGPVLKYNMLLVDEINRMSPRSQAALLGPMAQGTVTIGEQAEKIPKPFVVYATMNPIESQGVYHLSEAQLDRFLLQIPFPYHSYDGITTVLGYQNAEKTQEKINSLNPVLTLNEILEAREEVNKIPLGEAKKWISAIYLASCPVNNLGRRAPAGWKPVKETEKCVQYGPGPRAIRDFAQAARGLAYLRGRTISWDYIERLAIPVLRHRIILRRQLPEDYRQQAAIDQVDMFIERTVKEADTRWKDLPDFDQKSSNIVDTKYEVV